jgi:hypothetical protein
LERGLQLSQTSRVVGAVHLDQLLSARAAAQDTDGPAGQLEGVSQQFQQRGVRCSFDGWRMHLHLECVAVPTHNTRPGGTRL